MPPGSRRRNLLLLCSPEPIDLTGQADDEEFTRPVFAESHRLSEPTLRHHFFDDEIWTTACNRADRGVAVVGKEVPPIQFGVVVAPVDEASDHGAISFEVRRVVDGKEVTRAASGQIEGRVAFVTAPAEIEPGRRTGGNETDLLIGVLTYVGDPQVPRIAIEAESPGIAQANDENFIAGTRVPNERVVGRDRVIGTARKVAIGPRGSAG